MVTQVAVASTAQITERGARVIRCEAAGLEKLARSLGVAFADAVRLLLDCKGKVVLTGIGKGGRISEKVAASMSSLGIPAVFMHATEALHGDIGVVQPNDVVLVVSNSGTTKEVLDIIPTLRGIGVPIVSITRDAQSPLAKLSDIVLLVAAEREADALNMAPTSSTTALLALGDALAAVTSELKGFTLADYGFRHPAGALGKKAAEDTGGGPHGQRSCDY
jgi:arabinose-5-phosphate isomerase